MVAIRRLPGFDVPQVVKPKRLDLIASPEITWQEHQAIVERYQQRIEHLNQVIALHEASVKRSKHEDVDLLLRLELLDARPLPEARMKRQAGAGYIYVIQEEKTLTCKIGKAVNYVNRGQTFNVKLPFKWHPVALFLHEDYHSRESAFHKLFEAKRTEGEWFNLNAQDMYVLWITGPCLGRWFGRFETQDRKYQYTVNLPDNQDSAIVSAD